MRLGLGLGLAQGRPALSAEQRVFAWAGGKTVAWYRFDAGGRWQDIGATTAATTGDPVRRVDDWLGQSDPITAPSNAARPTLTAGGFQTSQNSTYMQVTDSSLLALTNARLIVSVAITADTQGVMVGSSGTSPYVMFFSQGGGASVNHATASGTVYVDDTLITQTTGGLEIAIRNLGDKRVENRGHSGTGFTVYNVFAYPAGTATQGTTGFFKDVFICDEGDLDAEIEADIKAAIDARL